MKHTVPIKNNYEFRRLYAKGKSASSPLIVVYCRKNRTNGSRLGITVSTKVGKAVVRNKVRRRLKEIYRTNEENVAEGYDVVIVARVRCRHGEYWQMEKDFLRVIKRLGIYKDKAGEQ